MKSSISTPLVTVEHGLQVLRAFRCEMTALGNVDLVRRTGLSKAIVSRLTSTLLQTGFLRHAPGSRQFQLANGPHSIGYSFLTRSEMVQAFDPFLRRLADSLNVSVALAVGNGLEMIYVGYRAGHHSSTLRMGLGSVLPMGTTSIGHAYLWGVPAVEQSQLIKALRLQAGDHAAAVDDCLQSSFASLRTSGTCGVLGGYGRGSFGIATPLVAGRQQMVMALSCGKASIKPDLEKEHGRIAPELQAAARAIEEALTNFDGAL